ncbi:MAG: biotin/lipoyl-binding protein [Candidatus Malihini olakiniferum]
MLENSPKTIRITLWAIFFFFLFFILQAALSSIDEVTRGDGKAIPSSRLQKIQNFKGGIVTKVCVHEGQIINPGDLLLRLDHTRFASNVGKADNRSDQ